jgi:dephospho-CoA kinase
MVHCRSQNQNLVEAKAMSLNIGIAGYMGSGKSTVSSLLRDRGIEVIDADVAAKDMMNSNTGIHQALSANFGSDVIQGGKVAFKVLGERVFQSKENLIALNMIVHPVLSKELQRRMSLTGRKIKVLDAALIPMWETKDWLRELYWVDADFDTRLKRLEAKLPMGREEIVRRMTLQQEAMPVPGYPWQVIRNEGARYDLAEAVNKMMETWRSIGMGVL